MTLNKQQAQHDNEELYNAAVQSEIHDVLASDGFEPCYRIAQKIGKGLEETRWHLQQMHRRGEVNYRLGRYGV